MVELTPGSQVFIYQNLVQQAIAKTSYKAAASFLLNCFYTNDEMIGMNLSGANGKPHPDKHILDAIIGTVSQPTLKWLIITLVSYMYIQYIYIQKTVLTKHAC